MTGNQAAPPAAMLSAGNLNTAALTLFLALNLSVERRLPWILLDDPVQSMDEVHVAHSLLFSGRSLGSIKGGSCWRFMSARFSSTSLSS